MKDVDGKPVKVENFLDAIIMKKYACMNGRDNFAQWDKDCIFSYKDCIFSLVMQIMQNLRKKYGT